MVILANISFSKFRLYVWLRVLLEKAASGAVCSSSDLNKITTGLSQGFKIKKPKALFRACPGSKKNTGQKPNFEQAQNLHFSILDRARGKYNQALMKAWLVKTSRQITQYNPKPKKSRPVLALNGRAE